MVDFSPEDRIALIKRLIEEQKKEEETLKNEEEKLKKKEEELKKKKKRVIKNKEKVSKILEDTLEAEVKELEEKEIVFQRTEIPLQPFRMIEEVATPANKKKESDESEPVEEKKEPEIKVLYQRMPQAPTIIDVYKQLENIYRQIPESTSGRITAQEAQRKIYHELKAMANHWGTQKPRIEPPAENKKFYGKEIITNPDNESSTWQRLSERVKAMAQF